ncbi:hypothetical protein EDB83DRAFT_2520658 [Lactarius deliciosus]|nr:hypothetical protein EDB83DRAFT_2520658 [Lactarius deliciosus]
MPISFQYSFSFLLDLLSPHDIFRGLNLDHPRSSLFVYAGLERVLRIVDSPGSIIDLWRRGNTGTKSALLYFYATWSNRKVSTNPPPTMRSVLFLPSNTSPPHVTAILAPTRTQELMKVYNLLIFNTTPEFTKTLALVSSCGSPSSPPSLASFRPMTPPRGLNTIPGKASCMRAYWRLSDGVNLELQARN